MKGGETENDTLQRRLQLSGVLLKKPFGHQSNKWTKRFFIVKDGFLMYYADGEKKEFDKGKAFNIHPKGVLPLGGCVIDPVAETGHPYSITIKSDEIEGNFSLAAENEYNQEQWINILRESARITWRNAQLGDSMIKQLEIQGLQMAKEKQDYFDKLQNEVSALHDEKVRTEELEKLNEELEKEKEKMSEFTDDLKQEYESLKMQMDDTVEAGKAIEQEKEVLQHTTDQLQKNLEDLERQRVETISTLEEHQSTTKKLSEEKQNLHEITSTLQESLSNIEAKTKELQKEKAVTEERLKQKEETAKNLEEEKNAISEQAADLKESIKDLSEQKSLTEAHLKEEIMARMEAEKRLREAEQSLGRLEKAVDGTEQDGRNEEEVKEEMTQDVKTLKRFFENLAFEAKIEAEKPIMIQNAIHARKANVRRVQTMRLEKSRIERRSKDPVTHYQSPLSPIAECNSPPEDGDPSENHIFDFTQSAFDLRESANCLMRDSRMRHSVMGLLRTIDKK